MLSLVCRPFEATTSPLPGPPIPRLIILLLGALVFVIGFAAVDAVLKVRSRHSILDNLLPPHTASPAHYCCRPQHAGLQCSSMPFCPQGHRKQQAERRLVQFLCQVFVMSWTGALGVLGGWSDVLCGVLWLERCAVLCLDSSMHRLPRLLCKGGVQTLQG